MLSPQSREALRVLGVNEIAEERYEEPNVEGFLVWVEEQTEYPFSRRSSLKVASMFSLPRRLVFHIVQSVDWKTYGQIANV